MDGWRAIAHVISALSGGRLLDGVAVARSRVLQPPMVGKKIALPTHYQWVVGWYQASHRAPSSLCELQGVSIKHMKRKDASSMSSGRISKVHKLLCKLHILGYLF